MSSGAKTIQALSLILTALLLCHYGGIRLYGQTRAVRERQAHARSDATLTQMVASRFDGLLGELTETVRAGRATTKTAPELGFAEIEKVNQLKEQLEGENENVQQYFVRLEELLRQKHLSGEVLNRHREFVRAYDAKYETLLVKFERLEAAHRTATGFWGKLTGRSESVNWDAVMAEMLTFLEQNAPQQPSRQRNFDPRNLPHRSLKAESAIAPKVTREEWLKAFPRETANSQDSTAAGPAGAKAGDSISLLATAPPTPADLAETIEVKFTPDIRQLADSLGRNPVRIYKWVRNNIEFVPIWGSIQGAQLCFETRSCNAFDTSSLLISLLRYSGIPARYQMGTIEVPVERFKNWAGGFTGTEAAASLFASGGTPSVVRRANQSGQVVTVRLEHVWVKAFVDYTPSSGTINRQGDTWVELDASYKQRSFATGVDFEAVTPTNAQAFINQLLAGATIDSSTGSVTNINSSAIQPFIQQNVDQRVNYLRTNLPNATVGQAIGGQLITTRALNLLSATTPYHVLARANELAEIPDGLRHKVTFDLGAQSQTPTSADLFSYTASLPELAGQSILLGYAPASHADEQLVLQLQPLWPSSINLVPQLFVGSQRVAVGRALPMGHSVVSRIRFSAPTISTPAISNLLLAGEGGAIGLDLQGVSPTQTRAIQQRAQIVTTALQQRNFQNFTNRDFAETYLSSVILNWFNLVDLNNRLSSQSADVVTIRYPSAGLFLTKLRPVSLFGAVVSATIDGLSMDIDRDVVVSVAKDGDDSKTANLSFAQGVFGSTLEAELPSRMLSAPNNPVNGVATMQALRMANDQGIPVYQINQTNAAAVIPLLQIAPDELREVQDAINAGLEVTVSRTPVNFNGRSVLGAVFKDPRSGSATFLISGGTNGAIILVAAIVLVALVLLAVLLLFTPLAPIALGLALGGSLTAFLAIGATVEILLAGFLAWYLSLDANAPIFNLSSGALAGMFGMGIGAVVAIICAASPPCLAIAALVGLIVAIVALNYT